MPIGEIGGYIPDIAIGAGGVFKTITYVIIFILCCLIAGVGTYIYMRARKFNKKVVVFEKISGRIEPTATVRAMITKVGDGGDTVLYLQKFKKFVPTPSLQTGRNVYWFFIREDREWINFGIEDIDEKFREMGAYFLDKEMRYARAALQKNLRERFAKLTFLEKYGGLLVWTTLCFVIGIVVWLWFDKLIELAGVAQQTIEYAEAVMEKADISLGKLDRVCTGSGIA